MPWFIQLIGFLLLGTAIIVGVVVGLPYFITKALQHDQSTCDCWDCRNRRARAVNKRMERGLPFPHYVPEEKEERNPSDYWTTEELRTSYHVLIKGVVYEVGQIRTAPDGNCLVFLRNILTKVDVRPVVITRNMMRTKLWRKGFGHDIWR